MDVQSRGIVSTNQHRERVFKSERIEQREPAGRITSFDRLKHLACIRLDRLMKDGRLSRARVLHIGIDIAGANRTIADERAAQVQPALDVQARATLDRLRENLA